MKKITVVSFLALVFAFSNLARADFNTDAAEGAVHCQGEDVTVSMNADRSVITVHFAGDEAGNVEYDVGQRNSDGDTFVSYLTRDKGMVLNFDDRGDSLELARTHESIALKCDR